MKTICVLTLFSTLLCAQATRPASSGPIVGFISGPGKLEITPILGIASAAHLDAPVTAPANASKLYLPPRQRYALVEQVNEQPPGVPIALWDLQGSGRVRNLQPIAGAISHADLAAFSPKGTSAALYSRSLEHLQILTGLPGITSVRADLSTQTLGAVTNISVSDDGAVVMAANAAGDCDVWSGGTGWRLLPWNYRPLAWSFVANAHDLALSESSGRMLLFHQVDGPNGPPVILTTGAPADFIAATSDGENIIAADSVHHRLWSIELKTDSVSALTARDGQTALLTLRDGHTFFVSEANSSFSVLNLPSASAKPLLMVHPEMAPVISEGVAQ